MSITRVLLAAAVLAPAILSAVELDATFGTGGRVVLDGGVSRQAYDAILQRDGKIVVVGITPAGTSPNNTSSDPTRDVLVARFNADGTLDSTFDGDGLVTIDFGGTDDRGYSVAEQADGKLVVAGSAQAANLDVDAAVARLNSNGSLDSTFHGTGSAVLPEPGTQEAFAVVIQSDGKLLLGGYTSTQPARFAPQSFAVARLLADGSPDITYGAAGTGFVTFPAAPLANDMISDLALQADGKLVASGGHFVFSPDLYEQVAAIRLDNTGALDSTFGAGGIALIDHTPDYYQEQSGRLMVLPNQSLVLAGTNVPLTGTKELEGAVLRIGTSGILDTTFGSNGWARGVHGANSDAANALALDLSGNILVAGEVARGGSGSIEDMAVSRLTPNGALDASFGTQGHFTIDFSEAGTPYSARSHAVLVRADGRTVIVGRRGTILQPSGALDPLTQRIVLAGL